MAHPYGHRARHNLKVNRNTTYRVAFLSFASGDAATQAITITLPGTVFREDDAIGVIAAVTGIPATRVQVLRHHTV